MVRRTEKKSAKKYTSIEDLKRDVFPKGYQAVGRPSDNPMEEARELGRIAAREIMQGFRRRAAR